MKKGIQKNCLTCTTLFYHYPSQKNRKFCNKYCYDKSRTYVEKPRKITCTACQTELILNAENFSIQTKATLGFSTECRKCLRKRQAEYKKNNREICRIKDYEYRKKNPEWWRLQKKKDYEKHKQSRLATVRKYRKKNPYKTTKERNAVKSSRRRALLAKATGTYTVEDVKRIYKTQKGKCLYCLIEVGSKYHIEHIIPLVRGGTNSPENICIACKRCNLEKGTKLISEWKPQVLSRIHGNIDSQVFID